MLILSFFLFKIKLHIFITLDINTLQKVQFSQANKQSVHSSIYLFIPLTYNDITTVHHAK